MKILFGFIFLISTATNAQFAKIFDNDGFINVRNTVNSKGKIIDTINNNDYVYIIEEQEQEDWKEVFYGLPSEQKEGFIHKSRLINLNQFPEIAFVKNSNNEMLFENNSLDIMVQISVSSFDFNANKEFFGQDSGFYYSYKGKPFWGTDGEIPKYAYKFIKITHKGNEFQIPVSELEHLFNPTIQNPNDDYQHIDIRYDNILDTITISSLNSDGAGGYIVLFVINNLQLVDKKVIMPF